MSAAALWTESVRESGGKVLIHCRAGISRSATICIAYLIYAGQMTLDDAHDYLKRCRPLISPNLNFMRQLAEFETCLAAIGEYSAGKKGLRRPSDELVASVVSHCSSQLSRTTTIAEKPTMYSQMSPGGDVHLPKPSGGLEVENCAGKKRKVLSDLLLQCGPTPSKVSKTGLQPPPTPCMKQKTFLFDFATVAMLMSGHGNAASPTMSQSPLVSPS